MTDARGLPVGAARVWTRRLLIAGMAGAAAYATARVATRWQAVRDPLVPPLPRATLELQVAVHDLVEAAPDGPSVRVCRELAGRRVARGATRALPLGELLDDLAAQVGAQADWVAGPPGGRTLPTIMCPHQPAEYLVIGRAPAD